MARLITSGLEIQDSSGFTQTDMPDGALDGLAGRSYTTSVSRSGAACVKCDTGASAVGGTNLFFATNHWTFVSARKYYCRSYHRFDNLTPAGNRCIIRLNNTSITGTAANLCVKLNTDNTISLWNLSGGTTPGTQIGSNSTASLVTSKWHRIELGFAIDTASTSDFAELYLDGTLVATGTVDMHNSAPTSIGHGWMTLGSDGGVLDANFVQYIDDIAMNDDQGSNQNSYPGPGNIYLLTPISDNNRVGWLGGAGATANLWDAVNNTPPVGLVQASMTNTSQIHDLNNNTTDEYDANLTTYTTAGVGSTATVALVSYFGNFSRTTTSQTMGISGVSNPAAAEENTVSLTASAGSYPTGWFWKKMGVVYSPSLTLGSSPVLKIRKTTAAANNCHCDFLGAYVEVSGANTETVTATAAASPTVLKSAGKLVTMAVAGVASVKEVMTYARTLPAAVAAAVSFVRQVGKVVSVAPAAVASVVKQVNHTVPLASVANVASMVAGHVFPQVLSALSVIPATGGVFGAKITKSVGKQISKTQAFVAILETNTKDLLMSVIVGVVVGGPLSPLTPWYTPKITLQVLKGMTAQTIGATGTVTRSVGKVIAPVVAGVATIGKQVGKIVPAVSQLFASLATHPPIVRLTMPAQVASAGSLVKSAGKKLSVVVASPSNSITLLLSHGTFRPMSATVASAGSIIKQPGKILAPTIALVITFTKEVDKELDAFVVAVETSTNRVGKVFSIPVAAVASVLTPGVFARTLGAAVASVASQIATKAGTLNTKTISATVAAAATFQRSVGKLLLDRTFNLGGNAVAVATVPKRILQVRPIWNLAVAATPSVVKRAGKLMISQTLKGVATLLPHKGLLFNVIMSALSALNGELDRQKVPGLNAKVHRSDAQPTPEVKDNSIPLNPHEP